MVLMFAVVEASAQCSPARPGITIEEFLPDPPGSDAGAEWVELRNGTAQPMDLAGWHIEAGTCGQETQVFVGQSSPPHSIPYRSANTQTMLRHPFLDGVVEKLAGFMRHAKASIL